MFLYFLSFRFGKLSNTNRFLLHPLPVSHFTAATHYHLSYKECLCEIKELKFFNWFLRQILVDSKQTDIPSLHFSLLSVENLMVVQNPQCTCKFMHTGDPSFWAVRMSGRFFPSDTQTTSAIASSTLSCVSMLNPDVSTVLSLQINFSVLFQDYYSVTHAKYCKTWLPQIANQNSYEDLWVVSEKQKT